MRSRLFGLLSRLAVTACALVLPASAQSFLQPTVIPTGNWPAAVYSADVNADGFPDLIYIDHGATPAASTTHVLLNDGHGHFAPSATLATAGNSIAFGNFTGGGHLDLAWFTTTGNTSIVLQVAQGTGSGTFAPTQPIPLKVPYTLANPIQLAFLQGARIDPGNLQILAEDINNNVVFVFQIQQFYQPQFVADYYQAAAALPDGPGPMTVADLTNTGQNDLIVNGQNGFSAQIFLRNSFGLGSPIRFTGTSGIHSLLIQDVNLDGRPDLIAEGANGHIDVFFGNGDGTFQTSSSGGTGPLDGRTGNGGHLIALADLNHDNLPDALAATPAGISALLGNGTAYLGLKGIYNAGPGHTAYAVADFNNDGNLDLALDSPEGIAILFGNPDGSFQTSQAFAAGQPAESGALGSFSFNGNLDAIVSTSAVQAQLLFGHGDGTFYQAPAPTNNLTAPSGLWGIIQPNYYHLDALLDIAITADGPPSQLPTTGSGVTIQYGTGAGTFSSPTTLLPVEPGCTQQAPLYGTAVTGGTAGIPFLATLDPGGLRIFNADNTNPLTETDSFVESNCYNAWPHNILLHDTLNGDALDDLIVQNQSNLLVYFGAAGGRFTASGSLNDLSGAVITRGQMQPPTLAYPFLGPAIPVSAGGLGFRAQVGSGTIADLDRDGNNDVLVLYANLDADRTAPTPSQPNFLYIWYGSGSGKFLTSAAHPVNPVRIQLSRNFYQVAVADLNLDGIPDLILSDGYIVSVQLGKGDGTFGPETHFLAGQGINTLSIADVNHDNTPDLVVANGGAVLTNPVANLETLASNPDVNTGGVTVLLNHAIALAQPTGTVTAAPEPTTYGEAFSLVATFNVTGTPTPTGTVNFLVDGVSAGSSSIAGTTATLAVPSSIYSTLTVGSHTLTAVYSGDSNFASATFTGTHQVTLIPTTLALGLCVDPPGSNYPCGNPIGATPIIPALSLVYGQVLDGAATESATNLNGTITFYAGTYVFCVLNANLSQGANTCPFNLGYQNAGTTTDYAAYSGDATHSPSTSNTVQVTVLPSPTTAAVTSSLNPSTFGQSVTFTISVQGTYAPAAGPFTLMDGSSVLASGTLSASGQATFTTSTLAIGTHPLTVVFPATGNFNASVSQVLNQVVQPAPVATSTALTSSLNPSMQGQPVTFTAAISAAGQTTPVSAGTVTFLDGATALATINVVNGSAAYTTSALTVGTHPITAVFSGASALVGSTSLVLSQMVTVAIPAGFTLTVTPNPITVGVGRTAILLAAVSETGSFSAPVALTCSGLPEESACTFIQPTIPAGGGSTTLQVATSAPHDCGSSNPYFVGSTESTRRTTLAFAGLFGVLLLLPRRLRIPRKLLLLLILSLAGFATLSGCGHCTDLGTRPNTYRFTVTATPQNSSAPAQTQTVTMTVTIP